MSEEKLTDGLDLNDCKPSAANEVIPVLSNVLDMLTDLLSRKPLPLNRAYTTDYRPEVVSIPIILLRKSQLRVSQKLGLCVFLCLSVVMAVLAGIRASGFQFEKGYDVIWDLWWKYIEACVGCCMVSVSAFRSLFVPGSARAWRSPPRGPSTDTRRRIWRQFKDPNRRNRLSTFGGISKEVGGTSTTTTSPVVDSVGGLFSTSISYFPEEIKPPPQSTVSTMDRSNDCPNAAPSMYTIA